MRYGLIIILVLILTSCKTVEWNHIEISAGIDIPNPIIPINAHAKILLKETTNGKVKEEDIVNIITGNALIKLWLLQSIGENGDRGDDTERSENIGDLGGTNGEDGSEVGGSQ